MSWGIYRSRQLEWAVTIHFAHAMTFMFFDLVSLVIWHAGTYKILLEAGIPAFLLVAHS